MIVKVKNRELMLELQEEIRKRMKFRIKINNGHFVHKQRNRYKDFECQFQNLTSLENSPDLVGCNFVCSYNNLTSLNGGPKEVGLSYLCDNNNLISLEGVPEHLKVLDCCYNQLTTLEGSPNVIENALLLDYNPLVSLKGCPSYVGNELSCENMPTLKDISDMSTRVNTIDLKNSPNVEVFTKDITNTNHYLDIFVNAKDKDLIQRIKTWPYYNIVLMDETFSDMCLKIRVSIKSDNELFMEGI